MDKFSTKDNVSVSLQKTLKNAKKHIIRTFFIGPDLSIYIAKKLAL